MGEEKTWAIVTGASSGLGAEFATALAVRGVCPVLVARRDAPMRQLAARLHQDHGVDVHVEPLDLGDAGAAADLHRRLRQKGISPDILINNAAFGLSGRFLEQDPVRLRAMLQLDIVAATELTQVFGRDMAERGGGHILLVASLAAHQPTPLLAAYGAAKSYILAFGEALHVELGPAVKVTVLSPGLMQTEFFDVSGYAPKASLRRTMLPTSQVARIGLDALFAGKPSVVAGALNAVMAFSARLMPRHTAAAMALRMAEG